ncbi:Membrane associated serine protease, rhomboid family [Desulfonatronum thiosulfatophilum]|uniref:Membrane associated serine protease, rhomboid family n=1 Tax=Desulfonatronum thiosulfatophilum TaxID=617002 RepID=A0A1G6C994_9BACT|nr:rhomboid family intramembrane serine protease [Desulfonatronum thiosulfatophilum]SDB29354.1 Membrane associated serine protease, rhomboid family [Desulfonatronum thiosulfatophilum]
MNDFGPRDETRVILENLTSDQADQFALVLSSADIDYRFRRSGWGWSLEVAEDDAAQAEIQIEQYLRENPDATGSFSIPTLPVQPAPPTMTGLAAALLLLAFHMATSRDGAHQNIILEAGAHAARILEGEYWRTITALTLHADSRHLAGNMLGIAVFGTFLCRRVGVGAAWLLILLAGAGGNLVNAWLHQSGFLSIGASTAVFGAVGLLGGVRVFPAEGSDDNRPRSWILPLGAALGLLAMLGSDVQTDIGAHLMGCLAGFCLGIGYTLLGPRHLSETRQNHLLLLTLAILAASWWRALTGSWT